MQISVRKVLILLILVTSISAHARREMHVGMSAISHQWWSPSNRVTYANDINFDCSLWNASNARQTVTLTAYWTGDMPLLNGLSQYPVPGVAAPTTVNFILEPKQSYVWNTSYCGGNKFAKVYCANETGLAKGVPKGLTIQVQEDRGYIVGTCTIYNQSAAGVIPFSIPINAGKPF